MEKIIYKTIYSDKNCLRETNLQERIIRDFINENNTIDYKTIESKSLQNLSSFDRNIDRVINSMQRNDTLIISHINILGQSTHRILKRLFLLLRDKGCSLYIIVNNIHIHPDDENISMNFLFDMHKFLNALNRQKQEAIKNTLKTHQNKTGPKQGKKYKSKFDEHRSKIMTMHSRGISKKRICETIGIGTPQAIGKYIKAVNEEREKKQNKQNQKKVYIDNITMIDYEELSGGEISL